MLERAVIDEYQTLLEGGFVNFDDLRFRLDVAMGEAREGQTLFEFFADDIQARRDSKKFSKASIGTYTSALSRLKDYAKYKGRREIDFGDITHTMWADMEEFLMAAGYTNNYIHKIMSRIKTVLRKADKLGVNTNDEYRVIDNSVREEQTTAIYLNREELGKLYDLELKDHRLTWARDLFLIGAYTGLRYSDFSRLTADHIRVVQDVQCIDILTRKTKKRVVIPLEQVVLDILGKYDGKLPKMSQQKMNVYLKQIGEFCPWMHNNINRVITRGGETVSEIVPRYTLFTTHTARRSFATNSYKAGLDVISIMKITGHTTQKQFMKYIRVGEAENAVLVARKLQDVQDDRIDTAVQVLRELDVTGPDREAVERVLSLLLE